MNKQLLKERAAEILQAREEMLDTLEHVKGKNHRDMAEFMTHIAGLNRLIGAILWSVPEGALSKYQEQIDSQLDGAFTKMADMYAAAIGIDDVTEVLNLSDKLCDRADAFIADVVSNRIK